MNHFIRVVSTDGSFHLTEKVVNMMEEKGVQPNLETFSVILETMCLLSDSSGARKVCDGFYFKLTFLRCWT